MGKSGEKMCLFSQKPDDLFPSDDLFPDMGSQNDFLRPFFFWFFNFKKGVFYNQYNSNQDLNNHIGFWYLFYTS